MDEYVICTRLGKDAAERLDEIVAYLNETKPFEAPTNRRVWTRSSALLHLVNRFHTAIPRKAS